MKNPEKEKLALMTKIKEKEHLKATLQRKVPILIKKNDSGLDDLYVQISRLTDEIYLMRNKYVKL